MSGESTGITADRLQRIAVRLGNSSWCRHWLHWNYPSQGPWLMAISCLNADGKPLEVGLEDLGFTLARPDCFIYAIPRVDESGRPFTSPSL